MTVKIRPNCFEDLVAILALYRPGRWTAAWRKNTSSGSTAKKIKYLHPLSEPILKDTYGVIVYQEQVMQIAQVLGGYSMGDADILRRAMGKKIPRRWRPKESDLLKEQKEKDRRAKGRRDLRPDGDFCSLRFQQISLGGLCVGLLPDRLPQDSLSSGVHGWTDDLGNGGYGQGHQKFIRVPRKRLKSWLRISTKAGRILRQWAIRSASAWRR